MKPKVNTIHQTRARRRRSGVVYVEFLIVFIPIFILFLGALQLGLIYCGDLLVQHAANVAARAAVVVLPDDPEFYDTQVYDGRDTGSAQGGHEAEAFSRFARSQGTNNGTGGSRLDAIRTAASLALMPIAPTLDSVGSAGSVEQSVGGVDNERGSLDAVRYNDAAVAINFPTDFGANTFRNDVFERDDDVIVRVSYLHHCAVPVVNRLMCDPVNNIRTGQPSDTPGFEETQESRARARARIEAQNPHANELASTRTPPEQALGDGRFYLIRGEAMLPMQGADYEY